MDINQILQDEIDFMTPMRTYLESYPLLRPWEQLYVDYMMIDPQAPMGNSNAMAIAGMPRAVFTQDVIGNLVLHQEINWIFTMRRWTNDNELRRDIGNFIANFNLWVNKCQSLRKMEYDVPLLPNFGKNDFIEASGGMGMGSTAEPNVDEFQIQVHIAFDIDFEREEY